MRYNLKVKFVSCYLAVQKGTKYNSTMFSEVYYSSELLIENILFTKHKLFVSKNCAFLVYGKEQKGVVRKKHISMYFLITSTAFFSKEY